MSPVSPVKKAMKKPTATKKAPAHPLACPFALRPSSPHVLVPCRLYPFLPFLSLPAPISLFRFC